MRSFVSPLKTLLARGLLALALLVSQQHAAVHWLSHAIDATHQKAPGSAGPDHCDECLTLSALGAGAIGHTQALAPLAAQHAKPAAPALPDAPVALRLAFRSRAPPILA